jgi:hypothetical protein
MYIFSSCFCALSGSQGNTPELDQDDRDIVYRFHYSQRQNRISPARDSEHIMFIHPNTNPNPTWFAYLRLVDSICSSSRSSRHVYRLAIGHINGCKLLSDFSHIRDPPRASSAIAGLVNRKASLVASPLAVHRSPKAQSWSVREITQPPTLYSCMPKTQTPLTHACAQAAASSNSYTSVTAGVPPPAHLAIHMPKHVQALDSKETRKG